MEDYRNLLLALEKEFNTSSLMGMTEIYSKRLLLGHDCIRHMGHVEIKAGVQYGWEARASSGLWLKH